MENGYGLSLWSLGLSFPPPKLDELNSGHDCKAPRYCKFYLQDVLVFLTNPMAIVFATALFPQFIEYGLPFVPQFLLLGYALIAANIRYQTAYPPVRSTPSLIFGSA